VQSYLVKPVDIGELRLAVARAREASLQAAVIASLHRAAPPPGEELPERARRVAASDTAVLLIGETGSGKTQLARQLHDHSRRSSGPFVALNCASIPESLADAELFGAERGAFTGAVAARPGAFELASPGTLFLDEIGELSPAIQAKLLTVLEDNAVRRVGGAVSRPIDARVIAATHRDLHAQVRAGAFRSDLLYRLDVVTLHVPPLRDTPERLPALAAHLLRRLAPSRRVALGPGEVERLAAHAWPGNIRELRNALERALIFEDGELLYPSRHLAATAAASGAHDDRAAAAAIATLREIEDRHIRTVLQQLDGNRTATARALGIGEATLRRKLR
jgi:two-component system, NtrC family, response regulator HydG